MPYLNGGLFLHHKLELDADHAPRVGKTLHVADAAFEGIFKLFASFTWHLDDTPGGDADEINPDVLGYIFEKYINQKAFGAYYTRPEITGYLADRSIHKLILERVYEPAIPELHIKEVKFDTVSDLLAGMDARTALKLVNEVLPSITILDPAVGSGAFLVAALKSLINVYYAVVGRAELGASAELQNWLRAHPKRPPQRRLLHQAPHRHRQPARRGHHGRGLRDRQAAPVPGHGVQRAQGGRPGAAAQYRLQHPAGQFAGGLDAGG